jgi:hypothetical protein
MVTVECAEELLGASAPSLRQHIENSGHFAVTSDEKLWVCRRWLCRPA